MTVGKKHIYKILASLNLIGLRLLLLVLGRSLNYVFYKFTRTHGQRSLLSIIFRWGIIMVVVVVVVVVKNGGST